MEGWGGRWRGRGTSGKEELETEGNLPLSLRVKVDLWGGSCGARTLLVKLFFSLWGL